MYAGLEFSILPLVTSLYGFSPVASFASADVVKTDRAAAIITTFIKGAFISVDSNIE
jgi:hypothetical protein